IVGKNLYIIDGHWQIFRAYYAPFRDLTSPSGEPTRATYVFTTMLMKLIAERKPDYLVVAMDSGREHLQRTRIYPEYKANRDEPPEDLPPQIERITQIIRAMGVPLLQKIGAEADDIMATIVRRLAGPDLRVVMVSRDKDLEQLIGPDAVLFDPMKDEIIDAARLEEVKGYPPVKAVEIQALCGDTSDNVLGVPGVGPKTAVKLIRQFGSAEAVVAHADELTPKLAQNIRTHADTIALAKKLVTLTDDVDVDADLPKFAFQGLDTETLRPIFDELGFRRLVEQLKPPDSAPHGTQSVDLALMGGQTTADDFDYRCVDTPKALKELMKELRGVKRLAVDTETTSVRPTWARLVGISLAWQEGRAVYIPVAGPLGAKVLDVEIVRKSLAGVFADPKIEKTGQNLKYDIIVLAAAGIPLAGPMFDTMLAAYILDAGRGSFGLDSLAAELLNHRCISYHEVAGKGKDRRKMNEVPVEHVSVYAAEDADVALRLSGKLRAELEAEGLTDLFGKIEMALMPVLARMETNGVRVDPSELNRQKIELSKQSDVLRDRIISAAGVRFNPDSPKQLAEVLFDKLGLPVLKRKKTGPSTDVSVLTELAALHEVPQLLLEYRQVMKLLSTYLIGLGECIHPTTGRVHTSFNQTGTATGRLSSSDPNLQNIPIRTELGRRIRAAFVAGVGNVLISADYSQVELRILAHLCSDETMIAAFAADRDIHRIVAAEVFDVPAEEVTPEQRARAKTVNFGIIYGQTAFGLAKTLRIGRAEAKQFIDSYRKRFGRIQEFLAECVAQAKANGWVETLAGRRRRIEGFDSRNQQRRALAERLAINSVVQGSAADLIKIAMINIQRRLDDEKRPAKMLLQIHDELLFETPAESAEADSAIIIEEMTGAMQLKIPLKVDLGVGPNWRDAK
ncbi:MAG: DNA polymerase I, partial [Phycisphaerae bacterium]|nr:DNA polymerase I [Phycisphaerae bacterium]